MVDKSFKKIRLPSCPRSLRRKVIHAYLYTLLLPRLLPADRPCEIAALLQKKGVRGGTVSPIEARTRYNIGNDGH